MTNPFDLTGKVAIVTGANTGIGQAIAVALAAAGADVACVGRTPAEDTVSQIRALGRKAEIVSADLSTIEPVQRVVDETIAKLGGLDILINNAGIMAPVSPLEDLPVETWDHVMAVNLRGSFLVAKHLARMMLAQGSGAIVNLASIGARVPNDIGPYGPSKAGVLGLTHQMAVQWGPRGIRANSVSPGMVRTPMSEHFYRNEKLHKGRIKTVPTGRIGVPRDIADAVAFMVSDAASYMNGQDIIIDGGFMRTALMNVQPAVFA